MAPPSQPSRAPTKDVNKRPPNQGNKRKALAAHGTPQAPKKPRKDMTAEDIKNQNLKRLEEDQERLRSLEGWLSSARGRDHPKQIRKWLKGRKVDLAFAPAPTEDDPEPETLLLRNVTARQDPLSGAPAYRFSYKGYAFHVRSQNIKRPERTQDTILNQTTYPSTTTAGDLIQALSAEHGLTQVMPGDADYLTAKGNP